MNSTRQNASTVKANSLKPTKRLRTKMKAASGKLTTRRASGRGNVVTAGGSYTRKQAADIVLFAINNIK